MKQFAPKLASRRETLFALDFKDSRLTLIYCVDMVMPVLLRSLNIGLSAKVKKRHSDDVLSIKVHPAVFCHDNSQVVFLREAVMCTIFEDFLRYGWRVKFFSNLHRNSKRNCVVFEVTDVRVNSPRVVSVIGKVPSKLLLQNGNKELANVIESAANQLWPKGFKRVEATNDKQFKFKFRDDHWLEDFTADFNSIRILMAKIIQAFHKYGYSFLVSGFPGVHKYALDSIYFLKDESLGGEEKSIGHICVFGLYKWDKCFILDAPQPAINVLTSVFSRFDLIQKSNKKDFGCGSVTTLKLKGYPWGASGKEGLQARHLLVRFFEELRLHGLGVHCSLNLSYRLDDVATFFLSECEPSGISFMTLSFHGDHDVRLINVSDETVSEMRRIMSEVSPKGDSSSTEYEGFPNIKLPKTHNECIGLLLLLLERLEAKGWRFVVSADLNANCDRGSKNRESHPIDLHTWFLQAHVSNTPPTYSDLACGWSK